MSLTWIDDFSWIMYKGSLTKLMVTCFQTNKNYYVIIMIFIVVQYLTSFIRMKITIPQSFLRPDELQIYVYFFRRQVKCISSAMTNFHSHLEQVTPTSNDFSSWLYILSKFIYASISEFFNSEEEVNYKVLFFEV